ncbi:MAG: DUF2752 domain-containing protein [Lentisphaeria bacterium]|nr:DUF2752 domain-containing protein [Lentisphaeria bacterium]
MLKYGLAGILVVSGLLYLYCNDPETTKIMPECLLYRISGLFCPGCGTGRAVYAFLHGDILTALKRNIILVPFCVLLLILAVKPEFGKNRSLGWSVLCCIVLYWIFRNVPVYPFIVLQP